MPSRAANHFSSGSANKHLSGSPGELSDLFNSCGHGGEAMGDTSQWTDLMRRFLEALAADSPEERGRWLSIWHLFIEHPWYQATLRTCAARVLREQELPAAWSDDLEQEAMLLLAGHLRRNADLHVNRALVEEHFPGWMGTIITRDCRQALRKLRRLYCRTEPLEPEDHAVDPRWSIDARIDFSLAADKLDDPERTVLLLYAKGHSVQEIAEALGLSYWAASRTLKRGLKALKKAL
jgi:RNA polymerase sigma factor (sigma-70 family)